MARKGKGASQATQSRSARAEGAAKTPPFERKRISDWTSFMETVEDVSGGQARLFRGVSSVSHALIPSVGRMVPKDKFSPELEQELFKHFQRNAIPFIGFRPENDLQWLAIAQHHSVPTRLLDWTENPLTAGYFAVSSSMDETEDCAVYVTPRPTAIAGPDVKPFEIDAVHFVYPAHVSQRIVAQRGLFTIHPNPTEAYHPKETVQIVIPGRLRRQFMDKLGAFGVDHASVFPDIVGLARFLAWQYGRSQVRELIRAERTNPIDPHDPQRGQWGGKPERNGWRLSATVEDGGDGWFNTRLSVESTTKGKELRKGVRFHLHDSFPEPVYDIKPRKGRATTSIWSYGAFTVGVLVKDDNTLLERDLSKLRGAPLEYRNN